MSWANKHIQALQMGKIVKFRPVGKSMTGKIESGQLCTVSPDLTNLIVGDIVLCKVNGSQYIHLISSIKDGKFQVSNNKGRINGWIELKSIFGKCIKVED